MASNTSKARQILRSLAQGIHPDTHQVLPRNSIVNDIHVTRAIRTAIAALDEVQSRQDRRFQLPANVGLPWSDQEEQQLAELYRSPADIPAIADQLGRTVRGVETRLIRLGLMTADERAIDHGSPTVSPKT
jgi:hypothetical protein